MSRKTQTSLPFDVPVSKRRKWRVAGYLLCNMTPKGEALGVKINMAMECLFATDRPLEKASVGWVVRMDWNRIRAGAEAKKVLNEYRRLITRTVFLREDLRKSLFREDPDFLPIVKLGVLSIVRIEEHVVTDEVRFVYYENEESRHEEYVAQRPLLTRIIPIETHTKEVTL
jgi:hypothetical protein